MNIRKPIGRVINTRKQILPYSIDKQASSEEEWRESAKQGIKNHLQASVTAAGLTRVELQEITSEIKTKEG